MNASATPILRVTLLLVYWVSPTWSQSSDISGGAKLIFARPENPSANSPEEKTAKGGTLPPRSRKSNAEVDDAIALGNAARDRKPPDFASAEKAYRLAWKLDPRDPRPYVGLGNVYMDQGKYAEAAQQYKNAIRYGMPGWRRSGLRGASFTRSVVKLKPLDRQATAEWCAYLAVTQIEQQRFTEAVAPLRDAIVLDPTRPEWQALLGYCLSLQGLHTRASLAYASAFELNPLNGKYRQLHRDSLMKAQQASARDRELRTLFERSAWEIRSAGSGVKGNCELGAKASLRCTFVDDELPYARLRWKIEDGLLLLLHPVNETLLCLGRLEQTSITMRCSINEFDRTEVWTGQGRG